MHKENYEKPQVVDFIAWAQNVQEWNPTLIAESLQDVFEAWLHTDFASDKSERGVVLFNINLIKKGILLINKLKLEQLDDAAKKLKKPK